MTEIVDQVAKALREELQKIGYGVGTINAGQLSDALAHAAIEAYQKALWTPYFDRPHGMYYPERRRTWANSLTAHIMNAIGKYLCRHGEQDGAREASRDLFEMLYGSGAYIVTDADRAEAGLSPRSPYGLTREDMKIMELKHTEAMLRPLPPIVLTTNLVPDADSASGYRVAPPRS